MTIFGPNDDAVATTHSVEPGLSESRAPEATEGAKAPESHHEESAALANVLTQVHELEAELAAACRAALQLSEQELQALEFLVSSLSAAVIITPSMLASHLRISAASTTKLLNRLECQHHISRVLHPHDRRSIMIGVDPQLESHMRCIIDGPWERNYAVLAGLSSADRAAVTRFLDVLTHDILLERDRWKHLEGQ